jgi:hypothetical protein
MPLTWCVVGSAQALWLYRQQRELPIFYDAYNFVSNDDDRLYQIHERRVYGNMHNAVITLWSEDACYFSEPTDNEKYFCGEPIVTQRDEHNRITGLKINLSPELLAYNPLFITWDYEKHHCKILQNQAQ